MAVPNVGEDGVISEGRPLALQGLPFEVGLRRQPVTYTCIDVSQQFLVVGSVQGYVWVIQLHSSRLLREYSEFKGNAITAVKLNPVRDYIAYGTSHGFVRLERISKVVSNKFRVQEKSGEPVTSLEWSHAGDSVFCGFTSGRLVHFSVKFRERMMVHVPLYPERYGSSIVQVSADKNCLLVSTLERAFVLDTDTHRLNQVGRKERKSGRYGGCLGDNEVLLLSRPGLRMWIADRQGNVLSTMAFKDVMSSHHLPALVVNSVPTKPLQYSRSWQFTTLCPWLEGKFVATFHEDAVLVLDPISGVVVGACTFQCPVVSLSTSGGFLYILLSSSSSKPLVRVALHHSYVPVDYSLRRPVITTSASSSRTGSMEDLLADSEHMTDVFETLILCDSAQLLVHDANNQVTVAATCDANHLAMQPTTQLCDAQEIDPHVGETTSSGVIPSVVIDAAADVPTTTNAQHVAPANLSEAPNTICHSSASVVVTIAETIPLGTTSDDTVPVAADAGTTSGEPSRTVPLHCVDISSQRTKLSTEPDDSEALVEDRTRESAVLEEVPISDLVVHSIHFPTQNDEAGTDNTDIVPIVLSLSDGTAAIVVEPDATEGLHNTKEQSRRLRMSQAAGDELVLDSKQTKRKKKKLKAKKLSSATSSTSVSMEMLADIAEEDNNDEDDMSELSSDQPTEIHARTSPILGGGELMEEETKELLVVVPSEATRSSEECTVIDNQSGQTFISELEFGGQLGVEVDPVFQGVEQKFESRQEVEAESQSCQEAVEEKVEKTGKENLEKQAKTDEIVQDELVNLEAFKGIGKDSVGELCDKTTEGSSDVCEKSPVTSMLYHSPSPSLQDITDDPLYRNSDEECASEEVITEEAKHEEKEQRSLLKQHSVLQPALSDPLFNEETLETGTSAERSRSILSAEACARPGGCHPPRLATSWIEVDERDMLSIDQRMFDASDSSHESDQEHATGVDMFESQVVDDFYDLCGDLVTNTDKHPAQPTSLGSLETSGSTSATFGAALHLCECQDAEATTPSEERSSEVETWDTWLTIQYPSHHTIHSVCLSDALLWVVNSRGRVYCSLLASCGRDWQPIKKPMNQVSSSPSGHIVWGTYHQNGYVRLGIGMNPAGSAWKNVTKSSSVAHKIKYLAVDEDAVWAITVDNRVLFRKGVDEKNPEGNVWQEVGFGTNFTSIACRMHVVWAVNKDNKVLFRDGITPSSPSGKRWAELKSSKMAAVSLTSDGVAWGITQDGSVGFRTGISPAKPGGKGPWWEVAVDKGTRASSPINTLLQVMSADGNHRLSFAGSSLVSLPTHHQGTTLSASSNAGVIVLEAGHKLYWCRQTATGYHYIPACKQKMMQFITWSHVAAGGTAIWFVKNDGDLYCLGPGDTLRRIEVPSSVELISASPNCLWVISKDMVWSRQGMTAELPEGISFDYIELSTLLHDKKLRSVACAKKVAWGVDSSGIPHFRFGVHAREPGTGMSPAWVPVEDSPTSLSSLLQITVCPDGWLVWACDEDYNIYAREGVTFDFPVGRRWVKIPKQKAKELCATNDRVYGLTPTGDLICRCGVREKNIQGIAWRKLPGRYNHITTGAFGELWVLDSNGRVWKQEWRVIHMTKYSDTSVIADPESWEFL